MEREKERDGEREIEKREHREREGVSEIERPKREERSVRE